MSGGSRLRRLLVGGSGALTFGGGDLLARLRSELDPSADSSSSAPWRNTAVIAALGGVTTSAILPWWFATLDSVFGRTMLDRRVVLAKMLADQAFYAPFAVTLFVFAQAEICGLPSARAMSREDLTRLWLADCLVWPFINWVNFRHVPLFFRPLFVACCQLLWQTFMSLSCQTNMKLIPSTKQNHRLLNSVMNC